MDDPRDQKIMKCLLDSPDGVKYGELVQKTQFPKKTLTHHLKNLVEDKHVERIKKGKASNSTTIYKAIISKEQMAMITNLLDLSFLYNEFFKKARGNKISLASAIPHFLQLISTLYYDMISLYLLYPNGKALYNTSVKIVQDRLDELQKIILKKFSKKQLAQIKVESNLIYNLDTNSSMEKILHVVTTRIMNRTIDEIIIDNEEPLHELPFLEGGFNNLKKYRAHQLQDNELKNMFNELWAEYYVARKDLLEASKNYKFFSSLRKDQTDNPKHQKEIDLMMKNGEELNRIQHEFAKKKEFSPKKLRHRF